MAHGFHHIGDDHYHIGDGFADNGSADIGYGSVQSSLAYDTGSPPLLPFVSYGPAVRYRSL